MSISFACECGKTFNVAEEYAGKRTKCPACGVELTFPESEPEHLSDEDKAFRALADGPDAEPTPTPAPLWNEPTTDDTPDQAESKVVAPYPPTEPRSTRTDDYNPRLNMGIGALTGGAVWMGCILVFGGEFSFVAVFLLLYGVFSCLSGLVYRR